MSGKEGEEGGLSMEQKVDEAGEAAALGALFLEQAATGKHTVREVVFTSKKGTFSLAPCTTGKHMAAAEEAATGEKGTSSAPEETLTGGKRKSSAGDREAFDMFPAQESASVFKHWSDPLPKPPAYLDRTGNSKLVERAPLEPMAADLFADEDAELRKRIKAELLGFPESKALSSPEELEEAIERIVKESKPETASVAGRGMVRMSNARIRIWLIMLKTPTVDDILGVEAGGVFPPGWLEKRRLQLEEQCRHKVDGGPILVVDKIRIDLLTKGYVVFHKEYLRPTCDEPSSDEDESDDEDEEEA